MTEKLIRCEWCGTDPLYVAYHDEEWGVPLHDDRMLFEMLILEGAQAGLSWLTILRRRETYRTAFDHFDPQQVARYDDAKLAALLQDPGIIRNRLKIQAAVLNAQGFIAVQEAFGSFDHYLWGFLRGEPIQNRWNSLAEIPSSTPLAETISLDLQQRGFKFVGATIIYAYLQATGVVNDHIVPCFRHEAVKGLSR
ncbi:MAG: DNA-3-methyladenine glycosylase I [Anaerolineae bacterium]|nr:DNA-3-methyladenine glycosylase I [Anaerolineae bacterium]